MPVGVYERPTYTVVCVDCGCEYTQKRKPIENPRCKKCQKKCRDKKYYENHKDKFIVDPIVKKERDKKYYEKNKNKLKAKMKVYYEENKEEILKRSEKLRRSRGEMPRGMSGTEKIALGFIQELFPNEEIRTNDRKTIKNPYTDTFLELDFYIPNQSLAIELNGPTHYKPIYGEAKFKRQQKNDQLKRDLCASQNITLIEIPLEPGTHYDRFSVEHEKLKETITKYVIRFRPDKGLNQCILNDHLRNN